MPAARVGVLLLLSRRGHSASSTAHLFYGAVLGILRASTYPPLSSS